VPDHSQRFWLTVQSICSDAERGRQWLAANGARLMIDLNDAFSPEPKDSARHGRSYTHGGSATDSSRLVDRCSKPGINPVTHFDVYYSIA